MFNRIVNEDIAKELSKIFLEVIIAQNFSKKALKIFSEKRNLRLIRINNLEKKYKRKEISWEDFKIVMNESYSR